METNAQWQERRRLEREQAATNMAIAERENAVTGMYRHLGYVTECGRCGSKNLIQRTPFPGDVMGSKRMCNDCYWVADDRPPELQPPMR